MAWCYPLTFDPQGAFLCLCSVSFVPKVGNGDPLIFYSNRVLPPVCPYHDYCQKAVQGLAIHCSKANKQARLVERKVCFISDTGNCERRGRRGQRGCCRWTSVQRPTPPHWQPVGQERLKTEGGATCRNSTVSSDSHLQVGHRCSDQSHLDCFRYS